jgi:hypothetical protein
MRTEQDLRQAFDQLAETAADPDHVLTALHRESHPVRRGRTLLVAGVALATTAAAIVIPLAMKQETAPAPAAAPTGSEIWRDRLSLTLPATLIYDSRGFSRKSQTLTLDGGNTRTTCVLTAYPPGAFDHQTIPLGTFGWQPAPDSWVTAKCTVNGRNDPAKAEQLAKLVNTAPQRLPAPYKIGYLPSGYTVDDLSVNPRNESTSEAPNNFIASISDGKKNGRGTAYTMVDGKRQEVPDVDLLVGYFTEAQGAAFKPPKPQPDLRVNGYDAWYQGDGLVIRGDGYSVRLDNPGGLPRTELVKLANDLEFAPTPDDTSTWFDAATAIP